MTTETITAFNEVQESLEKIRNNRTQRFPEAASPGDYIRQGDLLITLLEKPEGQPDKVQSQLAPGTTKGSRHVLSHGNVEYRTRQGHALTGPCVCPREDVTVTHPEHGDWVLPAGMTFGITYERAFSEELRRVQD